MRSAALLLIVAVANLGYTAACHWFGGSAAAWAYVMFGVEASALWLLLPYGGSFTKAEKWVCVFGLWEAIQRPIGRALFSMEAAPNLKPGTNLLDAATGLPISAISPVLLCWVIAQVADELTKPVPKYRANKQSDGA